MPGEATVTHHDRAAAIPFSAAGAERTRRYRERRKHGTVMIETRGCRVGARASGGARLARC